MELIIEFYKELDTLNLIIFWGIIIVIILLLIFSFILANKNKKLKKIVEKSSVNIETEVPIKKEEQKEIEQQELENEKIIMPSIPSITQEQDKIDNQIETEKKFVAEELVMNYNKESQKNEETKEVLKKGPIELPTGPYQRNVLREMSLSQTSPIGITRPVNKEDKKTEMAKDLEISLNIENKDEIIKQELKNVKNESPRKTEIRNENIIRERIKEERGVEQEVVRRSTPQRANNVDLNNKEVLKSSSSQLNEQQEEVKEEKINNNEKKDIVENEQEKTKKLEQKVQNDAKYYARELINIQPQVSIEESSKTSSAKYLEEVSKKLAEAETTDEVERTEYELEQEENAIISYKELMEKKDSIKTIDEEEAVISIEELLNRKKNQEEEIKSSKEDIRLYKLSDEEENDDFIKELKQFRNDL